MRAACIYLPEWVRVPNIDSHTHTDTESVPIVLTNTVNTCDVPVLQGKPCAWSASAMTPL